MANPKVSIVVPVYNTQKYLKRCMDSLVHQTFRDIEIILVDDGSGAECAALCDEIAATDDRIRVIHKKNGGLGYARNSGLAVATGDYIGFVDSDDYVELSMYETLYTAAEKHCADLVVSGFLFVGGNMFAASGADVKKSYFDKEAVFLNEELTRLLLGVVGALPNEPDDSRYGVSVCKNLFKASVIREGNLEFLSEREILSEDTLFLVDFITSANSAVGVPGAYYCYCRNEASLSKSYNSQRFEKSLLFLDVLEQRLEAIMPKEKYQMYLARLTQGFGRILCSQEIVHARAEKLKFSVLKKRLQEICTADRIKAVLQTYPWYRLPIKQATFAFAMKHRLYWLQLLLVILRDR